jgi:hypothetical protein
MRGAPVADLMLQYFAAIPVKMMEKMNFWLTLKLGYAV